MSIYGPPPREPRRVSGRALVTLVRLTIVIVAVCGLTCVGVYALLDFQRRDSSERLEIQRAEAIRLEVERSFADTRLQTAELLPAIPAPPNIEIPAPLRLQSAEILPPTAARAQPEPLQSAEILR